MALRWSSEFFTAMEHRDLQANAMAVDSTGTYVLLAGRRYIAIKDLDDVDPDNVRKFPRQSKYDVGVAEWNPTSYHNELCVISCNQRLEVLTWRMGELIQTHSLRAHTRVITDLNWHRFDPNLLASCSADTFIHIWDMRDARRPALSLSAIAEASQVQWNRISPNFLATTHDGDVKLWDQRKGSAPMQYIAAHLSKIHGLDWSPHSETQLTTSSQDSTVKFFDVCNARRAEFVLTTNAPVWRARYTPFGNGLVTVVVPQLRRGETSLHLWNYTNRSSPVHTFIGHRDVVLEFEWRRQRPGDSDYQLVTWSKDQTLLVWRIEPYLQKLCGHDPEEVRADELESDVMETASEASAVITQPLQQEFSLLNVLISNLEVNKMDYFKRFCSVTATANNCVVNLNVSFPNMYPNGVAPVFQIAPGSKVKESVASQLLQTITQTAQQRVAKNRTCLEPCLRQFVAVLEQLTNDPSDSNRSQHRPILESAEMVGSFNDACVPFPRTSGAKFGSVGTLVCFGQSLRHRRGNAKVDATTPRALSALGSNKFGYKINNGHNLPSYFLHKHRHRSKYHHKTIVQKSVITVYDVSGLLAESRQLAEQYVLDDSVSRICKLNSEAAASIERWDLVQAWTLAELAVASQQEEEDMQWSKHPFGYQLIESLISHYAKQSDLQMAAMLSCLYGKGQEELNSKKTSQCLASSQNSSPYHTIPPADVVAEGWVFPLLRTVRSNSLDNFPLEEKHAPVPQKYQCSKQFEYYKLAYAEMLHRWGLLYNRAEVLKFLCTPAEAHKGVEFLIDCQHCLKPVKNNACPNCKKLAFNCVICHISVRGSSNFCLVCGHGGHTQHMERWFSRNKICPSGCGCNCLIETAGIFS
ncbi:GATOR complex protein WDR59 isoform X2 [Agrilus planipennis]|uniref:GATOR complex protein WDR59 isoform X2 n=1 Tax=Agrilus planipennis TaxID=224129 RepID=A0A7F5R9R9_AGRPL|nr:GATOR complex protein WDR59 isoform X2 [Agrilus planipennis]